MRTDHVVEPKTSSTPTPGVKMMGAKGSESSPKSIKHRKKYCEASGSKETNKKTTPFGKRWWSTLLALHRSVVRG